MPANVQKKLRSEKVELGGDRIAMEQEAEKKKQNFVTIIAIALYSFAN
jgi:hypothetical protein